MAIVKRSASIGENRFVDHTESSKTQQFVRPERFLAKLAVPDYKGATTTFTRQLVSSRDVVPNPGSLLHPPGCSSRILNNPRLSSPNP
jgi:hypothetical protein